MTEQCGRNHVQYEEIGTQQEIRNDNKDELLCTIYGYTRSKTHSLLYHFIGILFLFIPYVIFKLWPKLKTIKYKSCSLETANLLLVIDAHGNNFFTDVKSSEIIFQLGQDPVQIRYFFHQHTKYIWTPDLQLFSTVGDFIPSKTVDDYLNNTNGLDDLLYLNMLKLYGPNKIEVQIKSYWRLFIEEVLNPFYMFQAFSVVLWFYDDYMSYSVCVIVLTLFSSITSLLQTRKQSQALHDLVESSKCHEVNVLRLNETNNSLKTIDPEELVPGDLVVLPTAHFIMPCDAVLLTGQCIVNESVLTGESVPITKTALHSSNELYSINSHNRQTIFCGTNVIQTRYYGGEFVLARVVRTGFDTTKGSLVKSIMYPTPVGLDIYKDSFKFVFVLFTIAAAGMCYCLFLYISRKAKTKDIIIRTLDIITIAVPAALPAAMAVGTVYSQSRLKKFGIFCISPPRINVCGKVKLACFDKTGTLTHDGLDMNSVLPCNEASFAEPVTEVCELGIQTPFVRAMATCHSLTRIGGELNGDPLDLNMFEFTKWELEEPGDDENSRFDMLAPTMVKPGKKCAKEILNNENFEIGIIRQFPFSSTLQCMSVICKCLETPQMTAFTKGAPEKVRGMSLRESLPENFDEILSSYTVKGYRVIAVAYKNLPKKFKWKEAQKTKRDIIECDLVFLGFLIMQNALKNETAPVIKILHDAKVRTVMITGDNILTAISVARECGMVKSHDEIFIIDIQNTENSEDLPRIVIEKAGQASHVEEVVVNFNTNHYHFAIDGKTWNKLRTYYPDLISQLLVRCTIFARFQPDQKTQLINSFQALDYVVSMVGDGANDCGALKAAHVGVSLSQAEASVAAPFTSTIQDISCIVHLMLEGRCALVTSFAIFKYMALYSLIQFISVLILYRQHSILGDHQFLFIDLVITTSLAVTIGRQGPSTFLGAKRPMSSLVSLKNVIPLILQVGVCAGVQLGAIYMLHKQHWFTPISSEEKEEVVIAWENTVIFTVSCFQYVILAVAYSKGRPYRKMLITNSWFLFSALSLASFVMYLMLIPSKEMAELMEVIYLPFGSKDEIVRDKFLFRYLLLGFPIGHFVLATLIEVGMAEREWFKEFLQFLRCKKMPKNKYKLLERENSFLFNFNDSLTL